VRTSVRRCLALAAALALAACGSSDEPGPDPDPPGPSTGDTLALAIGDTLAFRLTAADSMRVLRFVARTETEVALFYQVTSGTAFVTAAGPTDEFPWGRVLDARASGTLLQQRSSRSALPDGGAFIVGLRRAPHGDDAGEETSVRIVLYAVNRAPESGTAAYTLNDVRRETLENSADIDEFDVPATEGDLVLGTIDGDGATVAGAVGTLSIAPPDGSTARYLSDIVTGPLDSVFASSVILAGTGTHRVRVAGYDLSTAERTPYRFRVRKVNPLPETGRATLAPGDSLADAVDHLGDVDDFTVTGAPGQMYVVNVVTDAPAWSLWLSEVSDTGARLLANTGGPSIGTVRLTLPASGRVRLRFAGPAFSRIPIQRYRGYLYPVNPGPEAASAALALGDSVLAERIDREGDVDDFQVTVPAPATVNFVLTTTDPAAAALVQRIHASDGSVVWPATPTFPMPRNSGRLRLAAGTYRVRVWGEDVSQQAPQSATARGGYRLFAYRIDEGPEIAPAALTPGVPFRDRIDPVGDLDTLTFDAAAGQWVRVLVQAAEPTGSTIVARVPRPGGFDFAAAGSNVFTYMGELTETRRYAMTVDAGDGGVDTPRGDYLAQLDTVATAPESNPATLAVGGFVTEPLAQWDVDVFRVVGAPGQEISIVRSLPLGTIAQTCSEVETTGSRDVLGSMEGGIGFPEGAGLLRLGPDGELRVVTWARLGIIPCRTAGSVGRRGGSDAATVTLRAYAVDRRPEVAAATIAAGAEVREAIDHVGDVDEFTLTLAAGTVVTMRFTNDEGTFATEFRAEVLSPDGSLLAPSPTSIPSSFTALQAGTHLVRVHGRDYKRGEGPYRLLLTW
jgi:hypothetical protein